MQELYKGIAEILEVDPATITPDRALGEAWDSLAIVSTIALIDDLFGKLVSGQSLSKCEKVADVVALIESDSAR